MDFNLSLRDDEESNLRIEPIDVDGNDSSGKFMQRNKSYLGDEVSDIPDDMTSLRTENIQKVDYF